MNTKKIIITVLAALFSVTSFAKIMTPRMFSDNMLFQRGEPAKIWGTSSPNSKISVEFGSQKINTKADARGYWRATLDSMPASKTPRDIILSENGKTSKVIKNVLVGDVWFIGGQSNMAWSVELMPTSFIKDVINRAKYPNLRYFFNDGFFDYKNQPQYDTVEGSCWVELNNNPRIVKVSVLGLLIGEQLMKELDVPIAIVQTAVGGTSMPAWISKKNFQVNDYLKRFYKKYEEAYAKYDYEAELAKWNNQLKDYNQKAEKAKKAGKPVPAKPFNLIYRKPVEHTPYDTFVSPAGHYNTKVAPFEGIAIKGVIWYQGEADSGHNVADFRPMFQGVVKTWRDNFNNEKLPFFWIQLPSFKQDWGRVRQEQMQAMNDIKYGGIICTIDTGVEDNIHPTDKEPVAERMANLILQKVYGKDKKAEAPVVQCVKYMGNTAVAYFNTFGKSLMYSADEITGFEIKVSGKWIKPQAKFYGKNGVMLNLPKDMRTTNEIDGVRYLYKGWAKPEVVLYDSTGLPVMPFISDKANAE